MARAVFRSCLIAMLLFQMGAHLVFLQTTAWTRMALTHWRTMGFIGAIVDTFDGKHPCDLCLKVQKNAQSNKEQKIQIPNNKIDFYYAAAYRFAKDMTPLWTFEMPRKPSVFTPKFIEIPPPKIFQA